MQPRRPERCLGSEQVTVITMMPIQALVHRLPVPVSLEGVGAGAGAAHAHLRTTSF